MTLIDLEYYRPHIAGNARNQCQRFASELGSKIKRHDLLEWADGVLAPQEAADPVSDQFDPAMIASWSSLTFGPPRSGQ
ncbi:MAG: hypothetical protein JSR77_00310 [Planctomycetes bacterium]|nr:hypothetical protein [Planctomycetota bacterium]